jgi:GNAT superfamily N-acetyltransferase
MKNMPSRAALHSEWDELNQLLEASFKGAERDHRFYHLYKEKPLIEPYERVYEYDPAIESGLTLEKKTLVACFGVYPQSMQYGAAVLKNGGGRSVCTHPIARGKGYGQLVMNDARKTMFDNEVDFSILFTGSHHFYEKQGWRGGVRPPVHFMEKDELEHFLAKKEFENNAQLETLEVRPIEESDGTILSEIHEKSLAGEFFAAHREPDFWHRHLEAKPNLKWEYFVVEKEGQLLAALRYQLRKDAQQQVVVQFYEIHPNLPVSVKLGISTSVILKRFVSFLQEEALNEKDVLGGIEFFASQNNVVVKHLLSRGFKLINRTGWLPGTMVLITNPYSLFKKLRPEIERRAETGLFPKHAFWIQFDQVGEYPGGVMIDPTANPIQITIVKNEADLKNIRKLSPHGMVCQNIMGLTQLFAGIHKLEECDEEDLHDLGVQFFGEGQKSIEALFLDVTFDMANLDHF